MTAVLLPRPSTAPPASYERFIAETQAFVAGRGLHWQIALDAAGRPLPGQDWDIRALNESHERAACGTNGFAVDQKIVSQMVEAGVGPTHLRDELILPSAVQDLIKAFIVVRAKRKLLARSIRSEAKHVRSLLSANRKEPWELSSDDLQRYIDVIRPSERDVTTLLALVKVVNETLLSNHCPLEVTVPEELRLHINMALHERKGADKLPDRKALFEATRIAFLETPVSHQDLLRFAVMRILILTGLRLGEVLMLPEKCYEWQEHLDIVTGKTADKVGGVGRSLVINFFAEKDADGKPDLLVEEIHQVPDIFAGHVVRALDEILAATAGIRRVLRAQHEQPQLYPESDLRTFKTTAARTITTADLLFLVLPTSRSESPPLVEVDSAIRPIAASSFYQFVSNPGSPKSMFVKYGRDPDFAGLAIRPHSLRHLMNTELFRQEVADTIITHQFHRKTVAQSYEYDHRTLAERLAFVDVPDVAYGYFDRGSSQDLVARMVVSGAAASSHIGRSFKKIQAESGDAAAFAYLAVNSDGFHVTPYGFCTNSFSVNPCARHLKCFDDCRHFVASGAPAHVESLTSLREKLRSMRDKARARKANSVGRANQVAHAEQLLAGIERALAVQPGEQVFPQGVDRSVPPPDLFE